MQDLVKVLSLSAVIAFVALTSACFEGKIETTKIGDKLRNRNNRMHGVFYTLPRTVIKVDVPVVKTEKKPGVYFKFLPCFFPGEKGIAEPSTAFSIDTGEVRFSSLAMPDTNQVYLIKTTGGQLETKNLEMALTESGVFVKGSAESTNETLDLITSTIKDVAGLIVTAARGPLGVREGGLAGRRLLERQTPDQKECIDDERAVLRKVEEVLGLDDATIEAAADEEMKKNPPPPPAKSVRPKKNPPEDKNDSTMDPFPTEPSGLSGSGELDDNGLARTQQENDLQDKIRRARERSLTAQQKTQLDSARQKYDLFVSEFEQAQEIYKRIAELQKQRENLLGGDRSGFGGSLMNDTLKSMLAELDSTIKAYKTKYFTGVKKDTPWALPYRINPEFFNDDPKKTRMASELFRLSEQCGVREIKNSQGIQFNNEFRIDEPKPEKMCGPDRPKCKEEEKKSVDCSLSQVVWVAFEKGDNGEGSGGGPTMADSVGQVQWDDGGKRGFYYRIPGRANARLYLANPENFNLFIQNLLKDKRLDDVEAAAKLTTGSEQGRDTLSVAQFGITVSLPASTGGRRTKYSLDLYEASGGMKNFIMGSDALIKESNIDDLTGTASTIIDARNERKEARRKSNQPPDELSELERKRKILEEKKRIKELERDLGEIPNP